MSEEEVRRQRDGLVEEVKFLRWQMEAIARELELVLRNKDRASFVKGCLRRALSRAYGDGPATELTDGYLNRHKVKL